MATDDHNAGLPARVRQWLKDLKLVLEVLILAGGVVGAVAGVLARLAGWL